MELIILATLVALVLGLVLLKPRQGANESPLLTSWIPFLGVIVQFGKNPVTFILEGREKFGHVFTAYILGNKMTFLTHPEAHDVFFKATDDELSPREVYKFIIPVFGKGIVYDASPTLMAEQLRFVSNALTIARFKRFVSLIKMESEKYFAEKFQAEEGEVDISDTLAELTMLTASRCLHGKEIREGLRGNRMAELYHDMEMGLNPLTFFIPWLPTPAAGRRDKARVEVVEIFSKVIRARRASQAERPDEEKPDDLLQVLIDSVYRSPERAGQNLPEDEIVGILLALLFAGQHTSSITSSWTSICLSNDKALQDRVHEEQMQVMKDFNNELNYDSIAKMKLLHNCVSEALRMFPPLVMLMRKVMKPTSYKGTVIPAGNIIAVSPAAAHRAGDVYTDPNRYDPDRFGDDRKEDKRLPYAFIGFGGGRHKCVGENFAYLQVKTILSLLLRKVELELISPFPAVDLGSMVASPGKPCVVRYKLRK